MPSPDRESSGGYPWEATPGKHVLMTRATDKKGETQPDTVPFNELGINCNVMPRFQVEVLYRHRATGGKLDQLDLPAVAVA